MEASWSAATRRRWGPESGVLLRLAAAILPPAPAMVWRCSASSHACVLCLLKHVCVHVPPLDEFVLADVWTEFVLAE